MTKDEKKDELKNRISMALKDSILQQGFEIICKNLKELEKENAELKEKISVLLSCKNCPENKGGFICQKEYEDKCLAQKIQYIKELQEENKVLAQNLEDTEICENGWKNRVRELEAQIEEMKCWCNCKNYISCLEECCRKNISFEKGICYNCKKWEIRK